MYSKIVFAIVFLLGTLRLSGQCYPDRHSTNFYDGWLSCEPALNPNPARPVSHFIMYDYGKPYKLGATHIWNTNDPDRTSWGMRDVWIDYSLDGMTWYSAGEFTFPKAPGVNTYEGFDGPNLNQVDARYLLITAINNHDGPCYGLSEIRVYAEESEITSVDPVDELAGINISLYPNPFVDQLTIGVATGISGRLTYAVYDASGHIVQSDNIDLINGQTMTVAIGRDLPAGAYRIAFTHEGRTISRSAVKVNRT